MWKYLTAEKYNDFLLSLNLVSTTNIKMVNKILYNVSNNIDSNYDEMVMKKKNGSLRFLYEPSHELKVIQKRILENILEEMKLPKWAIAYKKGRSLKDNAKHHVNKKVIVKLDIKNFFDNIIFNKVYESCFNETLYPKSLGVLLTNLCCYNNKLPQGAPTSGYISNLVMRSFDERITNYCNKFEISYTRYCDDMTFSGDFNISELICYVKELLKENGFLLNKYKTRIIYQNNRQLVTGIVVNEKVSISKKYKRKIRQEMYYIKKYGINNHLKKIKILDKKGYLNKLLGKINFVLQIENNSKEFMDYKLFLNNI